MNAYWYGEGGRLLRAALGSKEAEVDLMEVSGALGVHKTDQTIDRLSTHYFDAGALVEKPPAPSKFHQFDYSIKQWRDLRLLDDLKQDKSAEIKAARDEALTTFTWNGLVFDADDTAQVRLLGLLAASKESDFTSEWWRLADNSWHELFAQDVVEVWAALKANTRRCFQRFAYLETVIAACETREELNAVQWQESVTAEQTP